MERLIYLSTGAFVFLYVWYLLDDAFTCADGIPTFDFGQFLSNPIPTISALVSYLWTHFAYSVTILTGLGLVPTTPETHGLCGSQTNLIGTLESIVGYFLLAILAYIF